MSADRGAASFGSKLRDARERRGVSLRQIASATKISVAALEALERDDISRLPGGIFSRAFVRAYAIEVGLDPEQTIQEFIAQFPNDVAVTAGHPVSDRVDDHEAVESERQTAGTFLWLAVISVPIAAALLYFSSGRGAARAPAKPVEGKTPATASQPIPSPPPPAEPSSIEAAASLPALARTTSSAPASAPAPQPPTAAAASAEEKVAGTDTLTIELSVQRPCWVSATVDGRKTIERLLQPGDRQTVDVRREMVLTAGDGAAIAMTLNGAEARPLGKPGEVVTARVNLTNFKDFLQAR